MSDGGLQHPPTAAPPRLDAPRRAGFWLLVCSVAVAGGLVIAIALYRLPQATAGNAMLVAALAALTLLTGRFTIKVPGQPATVTVSEFFVFTSLLLCGPAPATVTVALDGLYSSFTQKNKRWYRGLFNVAEPALGAWTAGTAYAGVMGATHLVDIGFRGLMPLLGMLAMTVTFFASNSVLTALAVGLENGVSPWALWKRHSFYLAVNYYAAAALAMLVLDTGLHLTVVALIAPLLVLSYVAYRAVSTRVEEAQRHTSEVEHLYQATIETLAIAVDAKDQVTHGHVRRVQRHTVALARALGVTDEIEIKAIEAASLLHDVGKLAVPDYVLHKPGALTRSEFEKMKLHVNAGATILEAVDFPFPVVPIVRGHHEQWSGGGYPNGLAGDAIPIGARILTVVDCFDAVTSDRPYRRKLNDEEALEILRSRSGTMYDPRVVEAFAALLPQLRAEDHLLDAPGHTPAPPLTPTNSSQGDGRAVADVQMVSQAALVQAGREEFTRLHQWAPGVEAALLSPNPGSDMLVNVHSTPGVTQAISAATLVVGEGISGWVAAHRSRIVNSDPALDLGDAAGALNLKSCMSVPVFAFGDLVAVFTVFRDRPRAFSDADVRLVGAMAQVMGMAVMSAEDDQRLASRPPTASVA